MNADNKTNKEVDLFSDEVAILDIFKIIKDSYKLILSISLTLAVLSAAYSLIMPSIYKVNLSMIPTEKNNTQQISGGLAGLGGLASFAGINLPQSYDGVETSLAIMQSRVFLEEFLIKYNILQELYSEDWDEESEDWLEDSPKMWSAVNLFRSMLTIKQDVTTGVIDISLEWEDPVKATYWLNALVEEINLYLQTEVIEDGNTNLSYLQEQLSSTKLANLQNVIYGLIGEQTKEIMLAKVNKEYGFKVLDPAVVPLERISPRRKVITILGAIIGLVIGLGYAFSIRFYENLQTVSKEINKV